MSKRDDNNEEGLLENNNDNNNNHALQNNNDNNHHRGNNSNNNNNNRQSSSSWLYSFLSNYIFRCVPNSAEAARIIDSDDEDEDEQRISLPPSPSDSVENLVHELQLRNTSTPPPPVNNNNNTSPPINNNNNNNISGGGGNNNNIGGGRKGVKMMTTTGEERRRKKEKLLFVIQQLNAATTINETCLLLKDTFYIVDDINIQTSILIRTLNFLRTHLPPSPSPSSSSSHNNDDVEMKILLLKNIVRGLEDDEKKEIFTMLKYLPSSSLGDETAKSETRVFVDIIHDVTSAQSSSLKIKEKENNELAEIVANIVVAIMEGINSFDDKYYLLTQLISTLSVPLMKSNIVVQQIIISGVLPINIDERKEILNILFNS